MEFKAFFVFFLVALLVAGCAPSSAPTQGSPEPISPTETAGGAIPGGNDEVREELIGKPSGDVDTGKEILANALSSDVRDLIERGRGRSETGYAYVYTKLIGTRLAPEDNNQATVHQRGATRNAVFYDSVQLGPEYFAAGVLLDSTEQRADAYCMERRCNWSPGEAPKLREVTYADYSFTTPSDWLSSMTQLKELGGETISGRSTMKLSGMVDGSEALIWLDRYSGLPMQVTHKGNTYSYTKITLGVKDDELLPS